MRRWHLAPALVVVILVAERGSAVAILHLTLIALAFVCAGLAAAGTPSGRVNLVGAALCAYFLSLLIH